MNRHPMPRILGLLLAGGEGNRLGQDKGLLRYNDAYFAEIGARLLGQVCESVHISLRSDQATTYIRILPDLPLIFDRPHLPGGPIRGLLSFPAQSPEFQEEDGVLALSTDLPLITEVALQRLKNAFLKEVSRNGTPRAPAIEGVFYERDGQLEPLCGIYTVGLMRRIQTEIASDSGIILKSVSLRAKLDGRSLLRLVPRESQEPEFLNVNTPEDLCALLRASRRENPL